jgi:hypothetical protein
MLIPDKFQVCEECKLVFLNPEDADAHYMILSHASVIYYNYTAVSKIKREQAKTS